MLNNSQQEIYKELLNADKTCLIVHQKPDGDALGSALALAEFFKFNNSDYTLFHVGNKTDYLSFINEYQEFKHLEEEIIKNKYSHLVFLDCGELNRSGLENVLPNLNYRPKTINLDHHQSNLGFADLNLVLPKISSTAELLFNIFITNKIPITKKVANYLLLGIYSDTQTLTNLATTPETIQVVSQLLSRGAQIKPISKNLEVKRIATLKLWAKALQRITRIEKYQLTYTLITQNDLRECGLTQDDTGGIANFFNMVEEEGVNMILTEMDDGSIKGSLRTTSPKYDVSKLAAAFGGGGHAKAAGFRLNGKLQQTNAGWQVA